MSTVYQQLYYVNELEVEGLAGQRVFRQAYG